MKKLEIYDPPMCCSTGVCGPAVDPKLAQFAADLEWLAEQGVSVTRFGLTQQPEAYAANEVVSQTLSQAGAGCLPIILADGQLACCGTYPQRDELAKMAEADSAQPAPAGGCCDLPIAEPTGGCCAPAPDATTGGCCGPDSDSQCC